MADGSITFSTALDNGQLERDIKDTERRIESLKRKVERSESNANAIAQKMEEADRAIDRTKLELRQLQQELDSLASTDPADAAAYSAAQERADAIRARIDEANRSLEAQAKEQDRLAAKWQKADEEAATYKQELEAATVKASELGDELARSATTSGADLTRGLQSAKTVMDAFANRVLLMARRLFVFNSILSILRSVRNAIGESLMENQRFAASLAALKGTVRGFASGVASLIAPALTTAVNICTAALAALARVIDTIFGTHIAQAVAQAQAAAQSAWVLGDNAKSAAGALGKEAKATKKLAKEQEKAAKSILAFDEINQLMADDADDATDSLGDAGGGGVGGGGMNPDWDALDVGKIDAKLAEIMFALGAALMAVGAVLAFSGINIPLGLSLMAIGALLIYTAYQEQWDKLPTQLRNAITTALVLTGMTTLVLGAVLAFSGVNLAAGIGLMGAGAALLVTAAALNWDELSTQMQNTLSKALELVGIVALVIGAALAFSGANIPLGIGIMLMGATALATAVGLNWEELNGDLNRAITSALTLAGTTALAIGAVLAFTAVNIPLGVALMAMGALSLVSVMALNWNDLPNTLQTVLDNALRLTGVAALAIGAVLCFTGVNLPIGLALMSLGAGMLIAGMGFDWGFILTCLKQTWANIRMWFDTNVRPVFSWGYWANIFKGMVNGLIWCLNAGLSGFTGFINSMISGIINLLALVGVSCSGWYIPTLQVPYLAKGAVIPPNREFMAVLGDQKSGNNIETPESLMRQVVRDEAGALVADAIRSLGSQAPSGNGGADRDIILVVDGREIARATARGMRSLSNTGELGSLEQLGLVLA